MNEGRIILSQVMDFLPMSEFRKCVERYHGNYKVQKFSCLDQFLCMSLAQISGLESLRGIETCLRTMRTKLYHAGIRGGISRSTLADANENRDWRIYADFAQILIGRARRLYAHGDFGVNLNEAAYIFDSTMIELCLSLFPWARYMERQGAIKLHTLMDLRGEIPCYIRISDGKTHDVRILDELIIEPGAFYIIDRGYTDFIRLYRFTTNMAYFIIRAKRNLNYARQSSCRVDKSAGLRSDQMIVLKDYYSSRHYPALLRKVRYFDSDMNRSFAFLTNNFTQPALTIAQLYKCRWRVETFFRWIKQHLRIKSFYGTSINAVKTQIWISICVYVLIAIIRKELRIDKSLSEILQILAFSLFEKVHMPQILTSKTPENEKAPPYNQLRLFEL